MKTETPYQQISEMLYSELTAKRVCTVETGKGVFLSMFFCGRTSTPVIVNHDKAGHVLGTYGQLNMTLDIGKEKDAIRDYVRASHA